MSDLRRIQKERDRALARKRQAKRDAQLVDHLRWEAILELNASRQGLAGAR